MSTTVHFPPPTTLLYHSQASSLSGSPTEEVKKIIIKTQNGKVTFLRLVDKKIIARIMFAGEREGLGTRI